MKKGEKMSQLQKDKIGKSNSISHLGKKLKESTKKKISLNNARYWLGKKRPGVEKWKSWKGPKVSYRGCHNWVKRKMGSPSKCEACGKDNLTGHKIHWANISGEYKRITSDWIRLCAKCHKAFDTKTN